MRRPPTLIARILRGITCNHRRMRECHEGCGHWSCPDCGVSFDDWGEGSPFPGNVQSWR